MTEEQRHLCSGLTMFPNGSRRVSREDFIRRFPSALERDKLAPILLEHAYRAQDGIELECALTVGFTFGFAPEHTKLLCDLLAADWHGRHDDIVSALARLRAPDAVDALFRATQWIPKSLQYDNGYALKRRCTWALADIGTPEARNALERIAMNHDAQVAAYAKERLDHWEQELPRKGRSS